MAPSPAIRDLGLTLLAPENERDLSLSRLWPTLRCQLYQWYFHHFGAILVQLESFLLFDSDLKNHLRAEKSSVCPRHIVAEPFNIMENTYEEPVAGRRSAHCR